MLEEILKHTLYIICITAEVVIKTYKRIEETPSKYAKQLSISNLKNTFESLIKNKF